VQRLAGDYPDKIRPRVTHLRLVHSGPPQPGLLDDVFGVRCRAEHFIGDGKEQPAVGVERVVLHAVEAVASGVRSQAAEKPCDSMPIATLDRAMRLAAATNMVSSTRAAGPSALSSP